jgi:AcrR family transcriptional regulator
MPYRRTPAVQARLDEQRAALVAAATAQLGDHGYAGCSIVEVAARAGVAAGTVYRHFDSKTDLVVEVFRAVVGREVAAVADAVAAETSVEGQVAAVVETFAGRALKSPRLAYALLIEPVDPSVDELRLEFRTAFRDLVAEAIASGVRSSALPPQDPEIVAAAVVGAIGEALAGPLAGAAQPDVVPSLVAFACRAVGAAVPSLPATQE